MSSTSSWEILMLLSILFYSAQTAVAQQSGEDTGSIGATVEGVTETGAEGPDTASVNLSKGATITIAIVVVIVVLFGIASAVLFYVAKKRQWEVRNTLRRSVRRVTTAVSRVATPRLNQTMTFPSPANKSKRNFSKTDRQTKRYGGYNPSGRGDQNDEEKGLGLNNISPDRSRDRSQSSNSNNNNEWYGDKAEKQTLTVNTKAMTDRHARSEQQGKPKTKAMVPIRPEDTGSPVSATERMWSRVFGKSHAQPI